MFDEKGKINDSAAATDRMSSALARSAVLIAQFVSIQWAVAFEDCDYIGRALKASGGIDFKTSPNRCLPLKGQ